MPPPILLLYILRGVLEWCDIFFFLENIGVRLCHVPIISPFQAVAVRPFSGCKWMSLWNSCNLGPRLGPNLLRAVRTCGYPGHGFESRPLNWQWFLAESLFLATPRLGEPPQKKTKAFIFLLIFLADVLAGRPRSICWRRRHLRRGPSSRARTRDTSMTMSKTMSTPFASLWQVSKNTSVMTSNDMSKPSNTYEAVE